MKIIEKIKNIIINYQCGNRGIIKKIKTSEKNLKNEKIRKKQKK